MMKTLNLAAQAAVLIILLFASCTKEALNETSFFDFDDYIGRYDFVIDVETLRNGESIIQTYESAGYVRKVNDYQIKVLFDAFAPQIDCKYEYAVRQDGSFFSLSESAGTRNGSFLTNGIEFSEVINLGNGNFKRLDITGLIFEN